VNGISDDEYGCETTGWGSCGDPNCVSCNIVNNRSYNPSEPTPTYTTNQIIIERKYSFNVKKIIKETNKAYLVELYQNIDILKKKLREVTGDSGYCLRKIAEELEIFRFKTINMWLPKSHIWKIDDNEIIIDKYIYYKKFDEMKNKGEDLDVYLQNS